MLTLTALLILYMRLNVLLNLVKELIILLFKLKPFLLLECLFFWYFLVYKNSKLNIFKYELDIPFDNKIYVQRMLSADPSLNLI